MSSDVRYSPPSDLLSLGEMLPISEIPQILFRFPGPCGLFDLSHGLMTRLAPPELSYTYFGAIEHLEFGVGIRNFGSLAVFSPATFQVVRLVDEEVLHALSFSQADSGRIFLGVNRPVTEKDFAWVPSETYFGQSRLKNCRTRADIESLVGTGYDVQQQAMFLSVRRYMEEMTEVLRRDIPRPEGSWYAVPVDERRKLLAEHGVEPLWS